MIYKRSEIHRQFGGQSQGGISTPSKFSIIFLFHTSQGSRYGYKDGWSNNNTYLYSGEGTRGDMKFDKGNRAIKDHIQNKEQILFFEEAEKRGYYTFLGEFNCIGYTYSETIDEEEKLRRGIVFELLPITIHEDDTPESKEVLDVIPLSERRKKAFDASNSAPLDEVGKKAISTYYRRIERVANYVKSRALGFCEGCGNPAPFKTKSGDPYLEPHHIIRRADKGPDSPDTVIALCPNCHKRVDHAKDGVRYNNLLGEQVRFLEDKLGNNLFYNVSAAIIQNDSQKLLIAKRFGNDHVGDCWEFVGGKLNEGETLHHCLSREIYEELGVTITDIIPYYAVCFDYEKFFIRLLACLCRLGNGEISLKDHSHYEWVHRETIMSYNLCSADRLIAEKLCNIR